MEFDPKDVADVSAELAESLLSANILRNKGPDGRSVIVISTFRNNTDLYVSGTPSTPSRGLGNVRHVWA